MPALHEDEWLDSCSTCFIPSIQWTGQCKVWENIFNPTGYQILVQSIICRLNYSHLLHFGQSRILCSLWIGKSYSQTLALLHVYIMELWDVTLLFVQMFRRNLLLHLQGLSATLHGVAFQKSRNLIFTTVNTSNFIFLTFRTWC